MTMPKGFKVENGYATNVELGGKSYQEIANTMTENGFKMNHSTARNIHVNGLVKIAKSVCELHDLRLNEKDIIKIAKDPRFQLGVCDIIRDIGENK
jgi:hypothetical protein